MKETTKFTVKVEMESRWVPYFVSFLKRMQADGVMGHSEIIGFYSDGDGDFRPKFDFDANIKAKIVEPSKYQTAALAYKNSHYPEEFDYYDAG